MQNRSYLNYSDWPLRWKLTVIVLITSGLLIGAMALFVSLEKYYSFRGNMVDNSIVQTKIIAANSTAAITFRDSVTAYEFLTALEADENVLAAAIYDASGGLFVSYNRADDHGSWHGAPLSPVLEEMAANTVVNFSQQSFDLILPIELDGRTIGHIMLRTDLSSLQSQLTYFLLGIGLFSLLLFLIGVLVCNRLNSSIVDPISRLARSMQQVRTSQRYDIRVQKQNDDEVGLLTDGFNAMLAQVQKRDGELAAYRDHLEELVQTRTHELRAAHEQLIVEIEERQDAQARLAHAQKMEAIGTLAGGVAHDLNNILSGIVTYPDLLLLDLDEQSPLRKPIETIRSSGKKAAAIVQDLLTLARRGVKIAEQFDLQTIVDDYFDSPEFQELQNSHPGIEVIYHKHAEPLRMSGSPVHLFKTVMNLIANSIEAMVKGGRLEVRLAEVNLDHPLPGYQSWRPGRYIELTISDSGVGIPEQYLNRIFEPFYSRKVMGRSGTGLGMAVVWGTVEDHQGHITVASKEGEGTTFVLYFPMAEEEIAKIVPDQLSEKQYSGYGQTVLVVDDSEDQRQIATDILNHLGYTTSSVASGEAALLYLKQHSVDVVILDMLMAPGIDGLETYKRILAFRPHQRAIIASGFSQSAPIEEARSLGVSEYVLKPYTVKRIGQAVHRALASSPRLPASPAPPGQKQTEQ